MKFRSLLQRGTSILTLVILVGGTLLFAPVAGAEESAADSSTASLDIDIPGALVAGAGKTTLTEPAFPPEWADDEVSVALAAHLSPDGSATGLFSITHREPTGELLLDGRGHIECMRTAGEYAVTIGRFTHVEKSSEAEASEGGVAAIIVQDNGDGGDTMIWRFGPPGTPVNCEDIPAQTSAPVEQGNFVVLD